MRSESASRYTAGVALVAAGSLALLQPSESRAAPPHAGPGFGRVHPQEVTAAPATVRPANVTRTIYYFPGEESVTALYIYPQYGQSPEQQTDDELACFQWALQQAGFHPMQAAAGSVAMTVAAGSPAVKGLESWHAFSTCLAASGYVVG